MDSIDLVVNYERVIGIFRDAPLVPDDGVGPLRPSRHRRAARGGRRADVGQPHGGRVGVRPLCEGREARGGRKAANVPALPPGVVLLEGVPDRGMGVRAQTGVHPAGRVRGGGPRAAEEGPGGGAAMRKWCLKAFKGV